MAYQYMIECKSVQGDCKDNGKGGATAIEVVGEIPPADISYVSTNHGGKSSGSSKAVGKFNFSFKVDAGDDNAKDLFTQLATTPSSDPEEFVVTRYTMENKEAVKDIVMTFKQHQALILEGGHDPSPQKRNTITLLGGGGAARVKVEHISFKRGAGASKMKTDQNVLTILNVDINGEGIIQPG